MKPKYKNPMCYTVYEKNRLCQACFMNKDGVHECTGLSDTENYTDDCPFFVPLCEHRTNSANGFERCDLISGRCEGIECKYYKPKGEES